MTEIVLIFHGARHAAWPGPAVAGRPRVIATAGAGVGAHIPSGTAATAATGAIRTVPGRNGKPTLTAAGASVP